MWKTLAVTLVLAGCAPQPQPQNAYSDGASQRYLSIMVQCAVIISKIPVPLTDAEKDWHYQRCLILNEATI